VSSQVTRDVFTDKSTLLRFFCTFKSLNPALGREQSASLGRFGHDADSKTAKSGAWDGGVQIGGLQYAKLAPTPVQALLYLV
jgi:hypothetical protein